MFGFRSRVTGLYLAGDGELNDVRVIMNDKWTNQRQGTKKDNEYNGTLYWKEGELKSIGLRYDSKEVEIKTVRATKKD